ncbi:MAG: rod shape-determining protein MreC [Candidatus Megaira endosymbiont of Carteria cerasiformis]|nr:rod shape-determining protein MreC [Candidatus Megaera polyxenophila]MCC8460405.1 rod shape-determining protein MreC [Candidatus Megaera polyxenophila]
MALIENRIRTKNHFIELARFTLFLFKKFCIIFLICGSSYLLYFPIKTISKSSLELYGTLLSTGSLIADNLIENVELLYNRLSYFRNLEAENIKLKLQLARMTDLEKTAINVLSENNELRKLLKVTDRAESNYITSRLVGANITPLSSSAVIEAGENNKVKVNDLVTNQEGLVGRIINVSNNYSSVMLLSDPNSRIPVITSSSRERGILANQRNNMLLIYLPEEHKAEVGELVYTSGDGKIYPYGILVGKVYKINNDGVFVKLSANLNNLDFVTIESISHGHFNFPLSETN